MAVASLTGRTVFITGASRGIGKAIGLRCAQAGANIVIGAKTVEPHPKLAGTIHTAAEEMEKAGGKALAVQLDIREPGSIEEAVSKAVSRFGGIDILVNNASAISLTGTADTPAKRYDLMSSVNGRGSFLTTQACLPHLKKGRNAHVLTISPPLNLNPRWFRNHVAYTCAKYAMSMNSLGWAEEFRDLGIASNCLWPRTAIATAAMEMLGGKQALSECRTPDIVADAAFYILTSPSDRVTGNFFIDDEVLRHHEPAVDLDKYAVQPGATLLTDFFLDESTVDFKQSKPNQVVGTTPAGSSSSSTSSSPSAGSASSPAVSVEAFFAAMHKKFENNDELRRLNSVIRFDIDAGTSSASSWLVTTAAGSVEKLAASDAPADCVLGLSHKTLFDLANRTVKPQQAFFSGALKISGNMQVALSLAKIF